jgi:predicted RecB family nuclease
VGTTGPVLVWHQPFEASRLKELAEAYPPFAAKIQKVIDRMVDLLPLAREHYYHPDMMGSWSIKAVFPTMVPDLAYDDLEVGDGMQAQEAFRHILSQEIDTDQRESKRKSLLAYCERDTLAMVRVVEFLR